MWVAMHGEGFESLLRQRNAGNPHWTFLLKPRSEAATRYQACLQVAKLELQTRQPPAASKVWMEAESGWGDGSPPPAADSTAGSGGSAVPPARPPRSTGSPQRRAAEQLQLQLQDTLREMETATPPAPPLPHLACAPSY